MYKVNRIHFLILREYQNRLSFVGIAQEVNDRGLLMEIPVQFGEQVRNMEEAPSKDCLYLNTTFGCCKLLRSRHHFFFN